MAKIEKIYTKKLIEYVGNTIYFTSPIKEQNKQFKARIKWNDKTPSYTFKQVPFDYKKYLNHLNQGKTKLFNHLEDHSLFKNSFMKFVEWRVKKPYQKQKEEINEIER